MDMLNHYAHKLLTALMVGQMSLEDVTAKAKALEVASEDKRFSGVPEFLAVKQRVMSKLEERIMQERLKAKPGSCMARHGARRMERQLRLARRPGRALRMVGA